MIRPIASPWALLALATALACAPVAHAAGPAARTAPDERIREVPYEERAVIPLVAHLGFQMVIEFDPQERIENVAVGDAASWQITPNRRATVLFVKPLSVGATNMTVLTTLRRYVFDLRAAEKPTGRDADLVYVLRFAYPPPPAPTAIAQPATPPPPPPPPPVLNTAYETQGPRAIAPSRIWDDGAFTYFEFPPQMEPPMIAGVSPDGQEGIVNLRVEGRTMIVDGVGDRFVLRLGREKLVVTNMAARSKGR